MKTVLIFLLSATSLFAQGFGGGAGLASKVKQSDSQLTYVKGQPGENLMHGFIWARNKLFGVQNTNPSRFIVFNDTWNLTNYTDIILPSDGNHNAGLDLIYEPVKDRVYAVFGSFNQVTVTELDPTNLTWTDVIADNQTANTQCLVSDGTNMYIACGWYFPSPVPTDIIMKYRLSDWSFVASNYIIYNSLTTNGLGIHGKGYDGTNLFWCSNGTNTGPGALTRMSPVDLSYATTNFAAGDGPVSGRMAVDTNNAVWVPIEAGNGFVLKIDKTTLNITRVSTGIAFAYSYDCYWDGNWMWSCGPLAGGLFNRQNVVAYNSTTGVPVRYLNLEIYQALPSKIARQGNTLWVSSYRNPWEVERIEGNLP